MMKHLNEAIIQAFLDGELEDKLTAQVTQHLTLCDECTAVLLAAEAETAELNVAFAAEVNSPVPTQRIWARIENEIDFLAVKPQTVKVAVKPWWQNIGAFLSPTQTAFAGGLAAIVLVSLFGLSVLQKQSSLNQDLVAVDVPPAPQTENPIVNQPPVVVARTPPADEETQIRQPRTVRAAYTVKAKQKVKPTVQSSVRNAQYVELPLAEEKDYLDSIAQLSRTVQTSNDFNVQPSFRVEYERNLAMMNQSIRAMQRQARRNPQDESAKRILFASYQNKIDLLNTVAEKSQLMATLR